MKPVISTPFAIPTALARHADAARLNTQLRELFLDRESAGNQYANDHATMRAVPSLFESRFDLFRWPEACIRELREFCWAQLFQLVADVNQMPPTELHQVRGHADAWFHITRKGGYFPLHNHPMASWSGVYCVDAGKNDGVDSGGLLSFPDPNAAAAMFKDAANQRLRLPYSHSTREYQLDAGQLIIFPSWLMHQVTPFHGDGERITVAFNAWFTRDGVAS